MVLKSSASVKLLEKVLQRFPYASKKKLCNGFCSVESHYLGKRMYGIEKTNLNLNQYYDYFLILDFEATCEKNEKIKPQEIIEFPCLKMNSKSLAIENIFHQYVKPRYKPVLTPFCVELTGILQEMVDDEPCFEKCLEMFHAWIIQENLLKTRFTFITSGDWDLKVMLPEQCRILGMSVPPYMTKWINIKKTFAEATGVYGHGMMSMLSKLNLPHEGRLHSGLDDCKNIANIVRCLARNHRLKINGQLFSP